MITCILTNVLPHLGLGSASDDGAIGGCEVPRHCKPAGWHKKSPAGAEPPAYSGEGVARVSRGCGPNSGDICGLVHFGYCTLGVIILKAVLRPYSPLTPPFFKVCIPTTYSKYPRSSSLHLGPIYIREYHLHKTGPRTSEWGLRGKRRPSMVKDPFL